MYTSKILLTGFVLFFAITASQAQLKALKTLQTANSGLLKTATDVNDAGTAVNNTTNATVNSAKSIIAAKNTLTTLFKSKKASGQVVIAIAGMDFEDENLLVLKEGFAKAKGVKSASAEYKGGTVTLEVAYKGKASELWLDVPKESRKSFKLVEMGDDNIILEYRKVEAGEVK